MPCKQVSLSIGALLGNWEEVCLLELLSRKGNYILFPFVDSEDIKILSLGAIWVKGQGCTELITLWGTKDLSIRPRCFGTVRA
jgi:hypothetical protein